MALVKEDGSGVVGANTYASATDLATYATARGITLPVQQADKEILLTLAMDAIESLEDSFVGERTDAAQALSWPRFDSSSDDGSITLNNGQVIAEDDIPAQLVAAQCQLACDQQTNQFFTLSTGQVVTEETVGPVTTKYAAPDQGGGDGINTGFQKFNAMIAILQRASATTLRTVRV